jgi:hypothetical protein
MNRKSCSHGRKKDGNCKKKPGRPSRSRRVSRSRKPCSYGRKKDGNCKMKPGRPSRSRRMSRSVQTKKAGRPSRSRRMSRSVGRKKPKLYMTVKRCKDTLKEKIIKIKREGKYSGKQAVAIAYSMTSRKHPNCKKLFDKRNK